MRSPTILLMIFGVAGAAYATNSLMEYQRTVLAYPPEARALLRQASLLQQRGDPSTLFDVVNAYRAAFYASVGGESGSRDWKLPRDGDHVVGVLVRWTEAVFDALDQIDVKVNDEKINEIRRARRELCENDVKEAVDEVAQTIHVMLSALSKATHDPSMSSSRKRNETERIERWLATISFHLAQLHFRLKEYSIAERIYLQTLNQLLKSARIVPSVVTENGMAEDMWVTSIDAEAKSIVDSVPSHQNVQTVVAALDQLATLYLETGRPRKAFEVWRRVERMLPNHDSRLVTVRIGLMAACWQQGDVKGAWWWHDEAQRSLDSWITQSDGWRISRWFPWNRNAGPRITDSQNRVWASAVKALRAAETSLTNTTEQIN